jgi:adenosine deaminase
MTYFGRFYLDQEKDIIITLFLDHSKMYYQLRTPNHKTGNLITNLASLCNLPITYEKNGYKIIEGDVPCYIDGVNQRVYILRLGHTKIANIYPDGRISKKASLPAIAKTLMSQTKDYKLSEFKTLVKTYIREEVKFHSDLHTHRNANLHPDLLIALGIFHEIEYPYYYIKKLSLRLSKAQKSKLEKQRKQVALEYQDSTLTGKYLERRIDDHTCINFADLILNNLKDAESNIAKIRASLSMMKDGQAVFTNLEKVYLYRYVFTKGVTSKEHMDIKDYTKIPDEEIVQAIKQMLKDGLDPVYKNNTLFQNELLWVARSYQRVGIHYVEISDTALVKRKEAAHVLSEIHAVMPRITEETGVTLRFLAAMRRIPLTIVKDQIPHENYFVENLNVLSAICHDPYVAGCDFVGEELNDIKELQDVISYIVALTKKVPGFVIRIHAGENDSLPDNVYNSITCVEDALEEGQVFPHMRIGHGLYTAQLKTSKGKKLLEKLKEHHVVLEFQITSNVRLNNLSDLSYHPLKQYLNEGIACVQGTDGGALYGTNSIDEQLSLERMLDLSFDDQLKMRQVEDQIITDSMTVFNQAMNEFQHGAHENVETYYEKEIASRAKDLKLGMSERYLDPYEVLEKQIKPLPENKIPMIVVGGSFNSTVHHTKLRNHETELLDDLLKRGDPKKIFFVIGPKMSGYEKYIVDHNKGKFEIYAFVPSLLTKREAQKLKRHELNIRVSIETSPLGVYKSFTYEIFKRRQSIIVAFDGNSAASNLIQDAKNSIYKSRTFIDYHNKILRDKANSLQGYITFFYDGDHADLMLHYAKRYFEALSDPHAQKLKHHHL